jgi:hypothetical protein
MQSYAAVATIIPLEHGNNHLRIGCEWFASGRQHLDDCLVQTDPCRYLQRQTD